MNSHSSVVEALAAFLRNDSLAQRQLAAIGPEAVRSAAVREGVAGSVVERLSAVPELGELRDALERDALAAAVSEAIRERELRALLDALAAEDVRALVFKGAHLAYLCYARPEQRPRLDSDVLVAAGDCERAFAVLGARGYDRVAQLDGSLVSYQCAFVRRQAGATTHVVDLHWRVCNPQEFGEFLAFDELWANGRPIPALGPSAMGLSHGHALAVALVHPVAHHRGDDRLIWDHDVARIADCLREREWTAFADMVIARNLQALCFVRLQRAVTRCGARVPTAVMQTLERTSSVTDRAKYLPDGLRRRHVASVVADVRALSDWRSRIRMIRQHLLPSPTYMRDVYAPGSGAPLALLYARRLVRGSVRWFRRPG